MSNEAKTDNLTDETLPRLTPREVADMLGVTPLTLAVWRSQKRYELGYTKIGGRVRYSLADVKKFLSQNHKKG